MSLHLSTRRYPFGRQDKMKEYSLLDLAHQG